MVLASWSKDNTSWNNDDNNTSLPGLPPSQPQSTNGWQKSYMSIDKIIDDKMRKAWEVDEQRPDIEGTRDLTPEELINISWWQWSLRWPGGSYLEPGWGWRRWNYWKKFWTPNNNYGGNEHGWYESSKDRIPKTIDELKFLINTAIDWLDKNLSNWYIK